MHSVPRCCTNKRTNKQTDRQQPSKQASIQTNQPTPFVTRSTSCDSCSTYTNPLLHSESRSCCKLWRWNFFVQLTRIQICPSRDFWTAVTTVLSLCIGLCASSSKFHLKSDLSTSLFKKPGWGFEVDNDLVDLLALPWPTRFWSYFKMLIGGCGIRPSAQ